MLPYGWKRFAVEDFSDYGSSLYHGRRDRLEGEKEREEKKVFVVEFVLMDVFSTTKEGRLEKKNTCDCEYRNNSKSLQ